MAKESCQEKTLLRQTPLVQVREVKKLSKTGNIETNTDASPIMDGRGGWCRNTVITGMERPECCAWISGAKFRVIKAQSQLATRPAGGLVVHFAIAQVDQ